MKEIKLTQGKVALVDDEDFEYLNQWKWHIKSAKKEGNNCYASRQKWISGGKGKITIIYMHHVVMPIINDMEVDHINGNGLDNRKENLRLCTREQNMWNSRKLNNTSGYRGVSWHKATKKWIANIRIGDNKRIYLGLFKTKEEAAFAYDLAAKKYHGNFAILNK